MRSLRVVTSVLLVVVGLLAAASASARVPQGFVGMNLGPYVFAPLNPAPQFDRLVSSGVESVRVVFNWAGAQPYASWSAVPSERAGAFANGLGNMPTSFADTDRAVTLAAQHGLTVLPTVIVTPDWEAKPHRATDFGLPRSDAMYANYVETLVRRYGPRGSFWKANPSVPKIPIRQWQVWNEPNTSTRWPTQPWAKTYVGLLRASRTAIRRADGGAKVVLAGLPNYSWKDLAKIYAVRGSRGLFDVVAIHPYTATAAGVITLLQRARTVMNRYGDRRKPMVASETGWPSSLGHSPEHYPFDSSPSGQAKKLAQLLPLLAKNRRKLGLLGFDVYTWVDIDAGHSFNYSGLLRLHGTTISPKPALAAFRRAALALDGCKVKGPVATRCLRH